MPVVADFEVYFESVNKLKKEHSEGNKNWQF